MQVVSPKSGGLEDPNYLPDPATLTERRVFEKIPRTVFIRSASSKNLLYEKLGLPEKPKRPAPPFVVFFTSIKSDLIKKYPNSKSSELLKKAAQIWEKTASDEKERIYESCKQEMEKYKINLAKYNSSLTELQKAEIKEAEAEIKAMRDRKIATIVKEKRIKFLERPKRPLNPYLKYFMSMREKKGDETQQAFSKKIAEEWKSVPESTKKKMKLEYDKEYENYLQELEKWEEKMIKEGNIDVVRTKTLKDKLQVYS